VVLLAVGVALLAGVATAGFRLGTQRAAADLPMMARDGLPGRGAMPYHWRLDRLPTDRFPGMWPGTQTYGRGNLVPFYLGGFAGTLLLLVLAAAAGGGLVAALTARRSHPAPASQPPAAEPEAEQRSRRR
jgi:hypothetical protein